MRIDVIRRFPQACMWLDLLSVVVGVFFQTSPALPGRALWAFSGLMGSLALVLFPHLWGKQRPGFVLTCPNQEHT